MRGRDRPDLDAPGQLNLRFALCRQRIHVDAAAGARRTSVDGDVEFDLVDRECIGVGIDDTQADQELGLAVGNTHDTQRLERDFRRLELLTERGATHNQQCGREQYAPADHAFAAVAVPWVSRRRGGSDISPPFMPPTRICVLPAHALRILDPVS